MRSYLNWDRDQDPGSDVRWGQEDCRPGERRQHPGKAVIVISGDQTHGVSWKPALLDPCLHSHPTRTPSRNPDLPAKWIQDLTTSHHHGYHPGPSHQHLSLGLLHTSQGASIFVFFLPSIYSQHSSNQNHVQCKSDRVMLLGKSANDSSSPSPLKTALGLLLPLWPPVLLAAAWTWWTRSQQGPLYQPTPLWVLLEYPPGTGLTAFNLCSTACSHPAANCPLNTPDWACPSPIVVVQLLMCPALCDPMNCGTPGSSVLHCVPEFARIHVHRVGNTSHPLQPPSPLPSIFPSIRVFSRESALLCFPPSCSTNHLLTYYTI